MKHAPNLEVEHITVQQIGNRETVEDAENGKECYEPRVGLQCLVAEDK